MIGKSNITSVNTNISILSDILQKARIEIMTSQSRLNLSSNTIRRVLLVCLLYMCRYDTLCNSVNITLSDAISDLNIIDFEAEIVPEHTTINISSTLTVLGALFQHKNWRDLINYSLEALEYDIDDYFRVEKSRGIRNANKKKKDRGIFYTPADVIAFMTSRCLSSVIQRTAYPTIIDCSCGSGVFLLQSFEFIEQHLNPNSNYDASLELFKKCIWGVDISSAAIDCCKFVFVRYFLEKYPSFHKRLGEVWRVAEESFFEGDAVHIEEIIDTHKSMPRFYDCIIGNPPYVSQGKESNIYIPFVDNMRIYASDTNSSALVLPLSICYSQGKEFIRLRDRIQRDDVEWEFLNYDRSPDSLFGDQVKTRNTILFRRNIEATAQKKTTTLQRWTSTNRSCLFSDLQLCDISNISITKFVPKISSEIERNSFLILNNTINSIGDCLTVTRTDYPLIVNGTAYNWICAYDHLPPSTDETGKLFISNTAKQYYLPDEESRDFSVAILSNRIAYWYWSVTGDGFHVNASFLYDYHIGPNLFTSSQYESLSRLGKTYSNTIKQHPTLSYNAGKKIVNYSHWEAMEIVRCIEKIITNALALPDGFKSFLEQWYFNQVNCNRDKEKR